MCPWEPQPSAHRFQDRAELPAKIRLPTWPGKYTACPLLSALTRSSVSLGSSSSETFAFISTSGVKQSGSSSARSSQQRIISDDNLIAGSAAQRVDWLVSGVNYNQASSLKLKQAPSLVVGANASCFISAAKSGSLSAPVGL